MARLYGTLVFLFLGGGAAAFLATGNCWPLFSGAIALFFLFGILLNFGIGNYAPTLIMLSLMGMDPRLCFPIMAAGAALTATGASLRYISIGEVDLRIAGGIALGGIPAVLVAAFIVKSLPLYWVKWLIAVVVIYTAITLLRAAARGRDAERSS